MTAIPKYVVRRPHEAGKREFWPDGDVAVDLRTRPGTGQSLG